MKNLEDIHILQTQEEFYNHQYPWCLDLIDLSESTHWKFNETNIENDYHDLKTQLTENELHGLSETLRLFTIYETRVGNDYWSGTIAKVFNRPEIQMMADRFAYDEVTHARSYSEINRCLGWDTKEFMTSYKNDKDLSERMEFIGKATNLPSNYTALDIAKAIGTFVFIEGAILFSNFAYIKHFKANGKNLLTGITSAIDYSVRDEGRHAEAGIKLTNTIIEQAEFTEEELAELTKHLNKIAVKSLEHERSIIDKIFSKGRIIGITDGQMERFVNNRLKLLLESFHLEGTQDIFVSRDTEIEKWFYSNTNSIKLSDFFVKQTTAYSRHWNKHLF